MSAHRYFTIMHGLRGCYMPDGEPYVVMVKTRRALKEAIRNEADMLDSGSTIGLSKRAIADNGDKTCFDCCALVDREYMREHGRIDLYLTHEKSLTIERAYTTNQEWTHIAKVSNWPGTLSIPCRVKKGRHNMARWRYDAWFTFEGQSWHGVQYGDNTMIIHCKKIKGK